MGTNPDVETFIESLSDGDTSLQAVRAAATVAALGTSLLIAAVDAEHSPDSSGEPQTSARATLVDTRRTLLALLDERAGNRADDVALEVIRLWKSVMTVASDVAAPSGLTGSIGTTVGVALVSAGLQAASLTMTSGPAAAPGTPSEHLVKEAQRTLEDARALVAAVYRNSGLIDAMKASAQRLGVDHDERRHDGR